MKVLGIDPSLRNFGIAAMVYDPVSSALDLQGLLLQESTATSIKGVRKNSEDLQRARSLYTALTSVVNEADIVIAEIPVGSQNARSMASYGVCIGILASINKPLIQVTPTEVKLAATGNKNATKNQMIEWAVNLYPQANWLTKKQKGKVALVAKNEHLADAVAVVHAGIKTDQFMTAATFFKS